MQFQEVPQCSGHVFRREGARGPVWYAKYRDPSGRQIQKRIGKAWTRAGRPAEGFFTKRTAEAWLRERLEDAEEAAFAGTDADASFATAAREWLR